MGTGELSSISMSWRPELPAGRSTVEKVIAPEKLGARVVVAALFITPVVKVDAEAEAVRVIEYWYGDSRGAIVVAPSFRIINLRPSTGPCSENKS